MHRAADGPLWLAPSDGMDFLACRRITRLELDRMAGEAERPPADPQAELVAREALAFERAVLDRFAAKGRRIARTEAGDEEARRPGDRSGHGLSDPQFMPRRSPKQPSSFDQQS